MHNALVTVISQPFFQERKNKDEKKGIRQMKRKLTLVFSLVLLLVDSLL